MSIMKFLRILLNESGMEGMYQFAPGERHVELVAAQSQVASLIAAYDALAPDWTQAPDWAQWYSIDTDGNCLWHRSQPITQSYPGGWITRDGNAHAKHVRLPLGIDWRLCIWQRSDVTP